MCRLFWGILGPDACSDPISGADRGMVFWRNPFLHNSLSWHRAIQQYLAFTEPGFEGRIPPLKVSLCDRPAHPPARRYPAAVAGSRTTFLSKEC
jgi:hypothetical protein